MESTIRIERYADQGRCVGHIDGRVVFVRFALPGELVRVVLDEPHDREDRFWTGEVTEVLEASEDPRRTRMAVGGSACHGGGVGGPIWCTSHCPDSLNGNPRPSPNR